MIHTSLLGARREAKPPGSRACPGGIDPFSPGVTTNHATQLWLSGCVLQIMALLLVPLVHTRKVSRLHQKLFSSPKVKEKVIDLAMTEVFRKSNRDIVNSGDVGQWCRKIASGLGFHEDRVERIAMAGRLHDIGKIRLRHELLNKAEPLDDEDWRELRRHPEVGYTILSSVNNYAQLAEFVLYHHERWDGTGYPLGLSGEDIPLESRIVAIADAYQAMVTDRPTRKRMTPAEAKAEITRCAGTQFDPRIATLFVNMP